MHVDTIIQSSYCGKMTHIYRQMEKKRNQCYMYDYSSVASHTHNIIFMNYNSLALNNCRCSMQNMGPTLFTGYNFLNIVHVHVSIRAITPNFDTYS